MARREQLAARHGRKVPLFVKIAPDLDESQVQTIAMTLKDSGFLSVKPASARSFLPFAGSNV